MAGWPRPERGEESPGSTETRCRITSGGGDPRESATENRPPGEAPKGAKSGKGETVRQERTARPATVAARQAPPGARPNRDGAIARFRAAVRVGRARRLATGVPEEWSSIGSTPRTEPGLQAI